MAVPFVYDIAEQVLDKFRSVARLEISSASVKRELKELEDTLSSIKAVILDAEEQVARNRNNDGVLRYWLRKFKDVCYDTVDVLDELEYEALWQNGDIKRKVGNFFSRLSPLANNATAKFHLKMKEIRKRLHEIEAEKGNFHLTERTEDRHVMKWERERERSVTDFSPQHNSDIIVGRDYDKKKIFHHLMDELDDENVSIISIVGMGGVGKTTLAELVYYDESVAKHFQLKMWVYVSEDFDVKKVTREIIHSAIHSDCGDITLDEMQTLLQDTVRDKRFLLVLDDVWDPDPWKELEQNLMVGANGSKIIVTTRIGEVAVSMGTRYQHSLSILSVEDSWSLFVSCAFRKGDVHQDPNLMEIGTELVKRCHGHPLSARMLGSLLSSTTDKHYWLSILESEMWDLVEDRHILPALRLCFNAMPSYLKRCFSYCSIFKKGCEIINTDLIQMWIAQGFIRPFDENQELEDIGHGYFQELCSLCFFQIVERKSLCCTFEMHDLIHDLARYVAQDECHTVSSDIRNISEKVQHVYFSSDFEVMKEALPNFLLQGHNVRTVLFPVEGVRRTSESSLVEICISRFKSLRVLDLSFSHFEALPFTIGNLKHLRYLNISSNHSIKKLPNFICKLLNLQSLRLHGCWELRKLPTGIGKLINLRHLLLSTNQMFLPKEGIGNLKSLRFLGIAECANLKSLGEAMQGLTALRTLLISDCGKLESLPSSMKHLTALETLLIENCEKLILTEWEEDIQDLRLSLQTLFITRLPQLETLPQWLQGAKNTLQLISIRDCWDLKALPEWLQYLTLLQKLEFSSCPRLWALPEGMRCLTALRELKIEDCPELNRRCEEGTGKDWPKIAHVPKIVRLERTSEMFRNRKRLLNKLLFLNQ